MEPMDTKGIVEQERQNRQWSLPTVLCHWELQEIYSSIQIKFFFISTYRILRTVEEAYSPCLAPAKLCKVELLLRRSLLCSGQLPFGTTGHEAMVL